MRWFFTLFYIVTAILFLSFIAWIVTRVLHADAANYVVGRIMISDREDGGLWQLTELADMPDESELPPHLRRHTRFAIPETLIIEMLDENGDVAASEVTVTENLSLGGASLFTSFNVESGAFVRVKSERLDLSIISIVRGKRVGEDGIIRLHIEFIDHLFPLEGIE